MTNKTEFMIPPGYIQHANGDLICIDNLSADKKAEHKMVEMLLGEVKNARKVMQELKFKTFDTTEFHMKDMLENHNIAKYGKVKGNVEFFSADGKYKVMRSIADKVEQSCEIEVAIQSIALYASALKEQAGPDASTFIDIALKKKNGSYNTQRLMEMMAQGKDIKHPLWIKAMAALRESLFISGSKVYFNFYQLNDEGEWIPLTLQFSRLPSMPPEIDSEEVTEAETAA